MIIMNKIIEVLKSPLKNELNSRWGIYCVKMEKQNIPIDQNIYLSVNEYNLQLLKEKLYFDYKVPEELIENVCKSVSDLICSDSLNEDI